MLKLGGEILCVSYVSSVDNFFKKARFYDGYYNNYSQRFLGYPQVIHRLLLLVQRLKSYVCARLILRGVLSSRGKESYDSCSVLFGRTRQTEWVAGR